MSLALLTLSLVCALPVQAQGGYPGSGGSGGGYPGGGPPPDPGHYWNITYVSSGTAGMDYINGNQYNTPISYGPLPWIDTVGETSGGGGMGGQYAVDATTSGSVATTLTWVPAAGKTLRTDPPASPVHIIETASASWAATPAFNNNGTFLTTGTDASDGLGDPKVSNEWGPGENSSGTHLIQKDGTTGTIILDPVQMSASSPTCPTPIIWAYASAGANLRVSVDTSQTPRAVTISSNVDPTFYKIGDAITPMDANGDANYIGMLHQQDADGTMSGDVGLSMAPIGVGPTSLTNIIYHASVSGNWKTSGSSYNWFSSLKQQGDNGSLYPPDFTNAYLDPWWVDSQTPGVPPHVASNDGNPTKPDHINIKCIDGGDGFVATGNYYMTLHPALENNYPDHVSSDFINPHQVSVNLISSGPADQLGGGISVQIDYSLSSSAPGPVAQLIAGVLGISVTFTVEKDFATVSTVGTTGLPAGWYTYVNEYDHYYNHYGKADTWGMSGYTGTSPYTIRQVPTIESDRFGLRMAPMQQVGNPGPGH